MSTPPYDCAESGISFNSFPTDATSETSIASSALDLQLQKYLAQQRESVEKNLDCKVSDIETSIPMVSDSKKKKYDEVLDQLEAKTEHNQNVSREYFNNLSLEITNLELQFDHLLSKEKVNQDLMNEFTQKYYEIMNLIKDIPKF